jgi:putative oxidoreductase
MATTTYPHLRHGHAARDGFGSLAQVRNFVPLVGRVLFTLLFLTSVPMHFDARGVAYAAAHGVPLPNVLVPLSGVLLLAGGASVALGFHARIGALLLALFLVPTTFYMHAFWSVPGEAEARVHYAQFMKNVSLFGATLMIAYFGSGPASVDSVSRENG